MPSPTDCSQRKCLAVQTQIYFGDNKNACVNWSRHACRSFILTSYLTRVGGVSIFKWMHLSVRGINPDVLSADNLGKKVVMRIMMERRDLHMYGIFYQSILMKSNYSVQTLFPV